MAFFEIFDFDVSSEIAKYRALLRDDLPELQGSFVHVRRDLLDRIDQKFNGEFYQSQVLLIRGLAGTGKSLLALDYARRQSANDQAIVRWLDARSRESIQAGFMNMAVDLGLHLTTGISFDVLFERVNQHLHDEIHFKLLFVLDNVSHYTDVAFVQRLPQHVQVLMTSQNAESPYASVVLEPFTRTESVQLVCERLGSGRIDSDGAERLVDQLGGSGSFVLPKRLILALAVFDQNTGLGVDEYIARFDRNGGAAEMERILIARLIEGNEDGGDAWRLLQYLAFLSPHNIWSDILVGVGFVNFEPAAERLRRLSLIDSFRHSNGIKLSVHPLIQELVRQRIESGGTTMPRQTVLISLLRATGRLMPQLSQDSTNEQRNVAYSYYHHLESVFRCLCSSVALYKKFVHRIRHRAAVEDACLKLYRYNKFITSDWKEALFYARKLHRITKCEARSQNGRLALKKAGYLDEMAQCYQDLGRVGSALKCYKRALQLKLEHRTADDDIDCVLLSYNYLGIFHSGLSRFQLSKRFYLRGLKLAKTTPPEQFSSENRRKRIIAAFCNNILSIYHKLGDESNEQRFAMRALRIMNEVFANEEHENLAAFYNNLSNLFEKHGKFTEQRRYQTRALDIIRRIGNGNERILLAHLHNNIGILCLRLADYPRAISHLEQALEIDRRISREPSFRALVYKNLGSVCLKQPGRKEEALAYFQLSYDIRRQQPGDESRSLETANALEDLGHALCLLGRIAEGRQRIEEALSIKNAMRELNDSKRAETYFCLGISYGLEGDWTRQVELIRRALAANGSTDMFTKSEFYYELGEAYKQLGDYENERTCKKNAADILEGFDIDFIHPHLHKLYQEIAGAYRRLGELQSAEMYERKASAARDDLARRSLSVWQRYEKRSLPGCANSRIAGGAFGIVYLVWDRTERNFKALKEIMVRDAAKIDLEIDILKKLTDGNPHPHLIKMCDSFDDNGVGLSKFIVFEYCPDGSLDGYIKDASRSKLGLSVRLLAQLCDAINHLHNLRPDRIIHRDIKPQNVLLTDKSQNVKLIDFGVSAIVRAEEFGTSGVEGTLGYMAPEMQADNPYNESVDIWSFGCVCFETLTGHKYYNNENAEASIRALRPDLAAILEGALCQQPGVRLTSTQLLQMFRLSLVANEAAAE